jgi:uncharacterized protein YciI
MEISRSAQALIDQMWKKPLFVVLRTPKNLDCFSELLEVHLQWAIAAEKRGEIFASGPFVGDGVPGALGGMTLLRAASLEEARQLVAEDPFIREGVYDVHIRQWLMMEGEITVKIRFSDRSYEVS